MSEINLDSKELDEIIPIINKLKKNISVDDIDKVVQLIDSKRIGNLKKVWDKTLLLKEHILDDKVKFEDKILPIAALLYVILPIDVVPDVLPVLGLGDDATVIVTVVSKLAMEKIPLPNVATTKIKSKPITKDTYGVDYTVCEKILNAKYIISLMSHAANADGLLDNEEKDKIFELIDFLLFSEEGGLKESKLRKQQIKIQYLKDELHSFFHEPISFHHIIEFIKENISKEDYAVWYLYAFTIVNVDRVIRNSERYFLDLFAIKLGISDETKNEIESSFSNDWFSLAVK